MPESRHTLARKGAVEATTATTVRAGYRIVLLEGNLRLRGDMFRIVEGSAAKACPS
jgi:hypothetical protein